MPSPPSSRIPLFFLLLLAGTLSAQIRPEVKTNLDTTQVLPDHGDTSHFGGMVIVKTGPNDDKITRVFLHDPGGKRSSEKKFRMHFFSDFDLGFNNYRDLSDYGSPAVNSFAPAGPGQLPATPGEFSLRTGKSVNVNIWILKSEFHLVHHYLNLVSGLGLEMNNYRYRANITYVNSPSGVTQVIQDSVQFSKNKLFTEYLTLPLLLQINTQPDGKGFHLSGGISVGYLVKSRQKQISPQRGKVKNNNSFNLEPFRTSLEIEVGLDKISLYCTYGLTPIHQYGLKQYPYSVGIRLGL
ncbi:MAG: outer membrane beta-barrel protein [Chitinophagaceae bacterium]